MSLKKCNLLQLETLGDEDLVEDRGFIRESYSFSMHDNVWARNPVTRMKQNKLNATLVLIQN
jgi:hypothetical protein